MGGHEIYDIHKKENNTQTRFSKRRASTLASMHRPLMIIIPAALFLPIAAVRGAVEAKAAERPRVGFFIAAEEDDDDDGCCCWSPFPPCRSEEEEVE